MDISSNNKVNDFLQDLESVSPDQLKSVLAIRDLFLQENTNLIEGIKYGGIVFDLAEDLIGGIFTYKKHISVEFSYGAGFTDKDAILEGKGKLRRHLTVHSFDDISLKSSTYFIKQAVCG